VSTQRRKWRIWQVALGTIIALVVVAGAALLLYSTELPPPDGPSAVGRTSYAWTDPTRPEPWLDDPAERRQLRVYAWYPTPPTAARSKAPYFPELDQLRDQFPWYERFAIRSVRTRVLADAEVAPAPAKYPVLLFSPGANNSSLFYSSLSEELASHGFVVVGMEHTHEGRGQVLPDGRVARPDAERQRPRPDSPTRQADGARFYRQRVEVRARDAAFVLDQLAQLGEKDPLPGGCLDLARVGVFGHSLGGVAATEAARLDARFQAVANLDGLAEGQPMYVEPTGRGVEQTFLYLGKPLREELPAKLRAKQDDIFRSVKEGSFRVLIAGADHTSFSDEPFWAPGNGAAKARVLTVVRAYLVEFFRRQLLGRRTELFDGPSTAYPEATLERFSQPPR
jgi:predicted dienelactone hydrolase